MPRYKTSDASDWQGLFLSVKLNEQILPGGFEYMLNEITGRKIDISAFDKKYKNDLIMKRITVINARMADGLNAKEPVRRWRAGLTGCRRCPEF